MNKYMDDVCDLFKRIPREKIDSMFEFTKCGAECDCTFLCFEEIYQEALKEAPQDMIILDLGCAYAFQSWYFRNHKKYIGVDCDMEEGGVLQLENSVFYHTTIQNFIRDVLPNLGLNLDNIFAICSAVSSDEARNMVRDTFLNYLVWYPGQKIELKKN